MENCTIAVARDKERVRGVRSPSQNTSSNSGSRASSSHVSVSSASLAIGRARALRLIQGAKA